MERPKAVVGLFCCVCVCVALRVEFLLKTDSGYPKICFVATSLSVGLFLFLGFQRPNLLPPDIASQDSGRRSPVSDF